MGEELRCKNVVTITKDGEGDTREEEVGEVMVAASLLEKRGGEEVLRGFSELTH